MIQAVNTVYHYLHEQEWIDEGAELNHVAHNQQRRMRNLCTHKSTWPTVLVYTGLLQNSHCDYVHIYALSVTQKHN